MPELCNCSHLDRNHIHPEHHVHCEECGCVISTRQALVVHGVAYCPVCFIANDYASDFICYHCGEHIADVQNMLVINRSDGAYTYHHSCVSRSAHMCPTCGAFTHEGCYVCGNCPHIINDYNFTPTTNFLTLPNSTEELFLGIELEITRQNAVYGPMDHRTASHTAGLSLVPSWCYTKYDASVAAGFEIVTQPMSINWLHTHINELTDIFPQLYHMGYRSEEGNLCGMHIHMSKVAFGHAHLYKLMYMIYAHPSFSLLLSQRNAESFERWASPYATDSENKLRSKNMNQSGRDRHDAINVSHRPTIEIRIFAGTLNPFTFYKNIEVAIALYRFSLDTSLAELTVDNFVQYVEDNKHLYRWLYLFLSDKETRAPLFQYDTPSISADVVEYVTQTRRLIRSTHACAY